MKKKALTLLILIATVFVGVQIANAIGSLTPSGTAGDDTQVSLNDIYDKLQDFTDSPASISSPFAVPGSVNASFHTLSEIYGLITAESSDLAAENILAGTEIFGIEGTYSTSTGAVQWQSPNPNFTACWDLFDSNFDGLVDEDDDTHSGCNGNYAVDYCQNLVTGGHSDWRLPTLNELISITDYGTHNPATAVGALGSSAYWSGTADAETQEYSWSWLAEDGSFTRSFRSENYNVMCVR